MFCPRCSNQQTSDTARYCTKCGFQISAVKDLIATDGVPAPPLTRAPFQSNNDTVARIRKRGKMLNIFLLVCVVSLFANLHNGGEILPRSILIAVLIAIMFARVAVKSKHSISFTKSNDVTLPESEINPVQHSEPKRIVTAEMVPVPSVTKRTTKLLPNQPRSAE